MLLLSIGDEESRRLFDEAVRSYSAGARRAATVSAWIAVAFDLIRKIRFLADLGDAPAEAFVQQLDKAVESRDVRSMQRLENELAEKSFKEFQLINSREYEVLQRLYNDRNLAAHPAFVSDGSMFEPSAEAVRAHLADAVDAVLAHPPVAGKRKIDQFIADTQSDSWPIGKLDEYVRSEYLSHTRVSVQRNIMKIAVKSSLTPPQGDNVVAGRCVDFCRAAMDIAPVLMGETLRTILRSREASGGMDDPTLLRMVGAFGAMEVTWDIVSPTTRLRVVSLLRSSSADALLEHRAFASGSPHNEEVRIEYMNALKRLDEDSLELLTRKPYPKNQFVQRSIELLRDSLSFRSAEIRMRRVLRLADDLALDDLQEVAQAVCTNDQLRLASDMPELLRNLARETDGISGARQVWADMGATLHSKWVAHHPGEPDGYYSYAFLLGSYWEEAPPVL